MANKEIKNVMKNWYRAYKERDDESYSELYSALRIMYIAGLIDLHTWKMVVEYDHKLFKGEV